MTAALVVGCALLGVVVGLVLNVVIDRVPAREPLFPLRFHCPHRLRVPADPDAEDDAPAASVGVEIERPPIPLAHCPVCHQRLPVRYLVVPLANGVLFAAAAVRFGADWVLPAYLVFFAALVVISVIDLELQIIPNRIVYPAMFASIPLLALAAVVQHEPSDLVRALAGGAGAWAALLLIHIISPAGMGFGDVRLSFLLGLFLGWVSYAHVVVGLFFGFLLGAVIGFALVAFRIRSRTDHVPFGPFLAAGAVLAVLFGGPLADAWL